MILPTPERVARGMAHWFAWFAVPAGDGRRLHLVMVPR